jgi:hypothetical protein
MIITRKETKDEIAKQAIELAERLWKKEMSRIEGGKCVLYTAAALLIFKRRGVDAAVQAGSMSWPVIRLEEDDGKCNTHFSYMWEGLTPANVEILLAGRLPEMHVWIALPGTKSIVDLTTGELRKHAEKIGLTWSSPDPHKYFWDTHTPPGVVYTPHRSAVQVAAQLIHSLITVTCER